MDVGYSGTLCFCIERSPLAPFRVVSNNPNAARTQESDCGILSQFFNLLHFCSSHPPLQNEKGVYNQATHHTCFSNSTSLLVLLNPSPFHVFLIPTVTAPDIHFESSNNCYCFCFFFHGASTCTWYLLKSHTSGSQNMAWWILFKNYRYNCDPACRYRQIVCIPDLAGPESRPNFFLTCGKKQHDCYFYLYS